MRFFKSKIQSMRGVTAKVSKSIATYIVLSDNY